MDRNSLCLVGHSYRQSPLERLFRAARQFGYARVEIRPCADLDLSTREGLAGALCRAGALAAQTGIAPGAIFLGGLTVGDAGRFREQNPLLLDSQIRPMLRDAGIDLIHLRLDR